MLVMEGRLSAFAGRHTSAWVSILNPKQDFI
jgi:hypothetical protein